MLPSGRQTLTIVTLIARPENGVHYTPKAKPVVGHSRKAGEKYRVFVSHARADKWIARTICDMIDAIPGAKSFRDDRDIEGGDSIPKRL